MQTDLATPQAAKPFQQAKTMKCSLEEKEAHLTRALHIALEGEAASPRDGAVFFSGACEKKAAQEFCRKNPGNRNVCMTGALQDFNEMKLFQWIPPMTVAEVYDIGDIISERFAQEASGNVTVFVGPQCKLHGTFLRIELPALLKNENVITINGSPKEQYRFLMEDTNKSRRDITAAVKREL